MSVALRLVAFGALLAAVFAVAAVIGGAADPEPRAEPEDRAGPAPTPAAHGHAEPAPAASHGAGPAAAAEPVRGLAVAAAGLTLELEAADLGVSEASPLAFRILERDGEPLRRFEVEHEKRMHLILVRRDGAGFQHLHPRLDEDGTWRTRVTLREPGSYRVFADFKTGGEQQTLAADINVSGRADYDAFAAAAPVARTISAYDVRLERDGQTLRFAISRNGETIHAEPYLGAGGHLVALREGDLAYLHTHPADHGGGGHDDRVAFETEFPSAGRYRLYFQFKHRGRVHTAEFTQEVRR